MIELQSDSLVVSYPEVHPSARVRVSFQRTLRIPDDGREYPLPPGLGCFPLRHIDDFARRVPRAWLERGGVMLPMYQSEAMWLQFGGEWDSERGVAYPFAIKIATGKINAVSGEPWTDGLNRRPRQDYVVVPRQPWLDGYCVAEGIIRQFVAMPLGAGYSAEEQVTGSAEYGGLQLLAIPMKREVFERRFPKRAMEKQMFRGGAVAAAAAPMAAFGSDSGMGLAPGGRMRQEIYKDTFDPRDWDLDNRSRCFVHLANSLVWRSITGANPPTVPPTAREYDCARLPWFEYYDDASSPVEGGEPLGRLKSVAELGKEKGDVPLPENESVAAETIVAIRKKLAKGQVREF